MKTGFSSSCCPTWDLRTILENAVLMGFDGIELRGLQGELHLPNHPELAQNHDAVRQSCDATNVELVCLGSSASFGSKKAREVGKQKAVVREYIELASNLGCPFVRVFTGDIPVGASRYGALGIISEALKDVADYASRNKVTILIENSGELSSSRDLWFLIDAISHPALQACWNPVHGMLCGERATLAVPRLGIRKGLVHIADARIEDNILRDYVDLGSGDVELSRLLELLLGVSYAGYLMVDWPKLWDDSLAEPEDFLPKSLAFLQGQLGIERKPLTAYKGDKNAPEYQDTPDRLPVR